MDYDQLKLATNNQPPNNLSKQNSTLIGYSIIHGFFDLCSGALILSAGAVNNYSTQSVFTLAVAYNLIAFGLQAPFGWVVDKFKASQASAFIGCLLLLLALLVFPKPGTVIILAGLGNAFFHVGGGSISLNFNSKKAVYPGIFVAPGAIGLFIGTFLSSIGVKLWTLALILVTSIIFIWTQPIPNISYKSKPVRKKVKWYELAVLLLLFSVAVRALYGLTADFSWKQNLWLGVGLTLAIAAGKALGGFLADKFGWLKTALAALALSSPLLSFYSATPALAILGAFIFQFTMPITVTALSNLMPGKPATAFGLTVAALVLGALPTFLGYKSVL